MYGLGFGLEEVRVGTWHALEKRQFRHWLNMGKFAGEICENVEMRSTRVQCRSNNLAAGWPIDTGPTPARSELNGLPYGMSARG